MPRTGRPSLPDSDRKDKTFRIRVTDEERAAISEAAEKSGETDSEWAREVLLKAAAKAVRV